MHALGAVVAGRFWCSYAWVSLTPTTPARPRAPVIERGCARVRVQSARVRSSRRSCRRCVPVVQRWCGAWCRRWCVVWGGVCFCRRWVVCCCCGGGCVLALGHTSFRIGAVAVPLFSLAAVVLWCCGCAVIPLFSAGYGGGACLRWRCTFFPLGGCWVLYLF